MSPAQPDESAGTRWPAGVTNGTAPFRVIFTPVGESASTYVSPSMRTWAGSGMPNVR